MTGAETVGTGISLRVRDVGGIDATAVELGAGVNVLAGRNATNRTSLLRALMAALGSDDVSLKADADEGSVELTIGGETYTRRLVRRADGVALEGDPYLSGDEVDYAECFAFLLETNDARQAVLSGGQDLRAVLLRPVDTDAIERQLRERTEDRREVEAELDRLEAAADRLERARERRAELTAELEAKRERRQELQAEMDADGTGEPTDVERAELLDELNTVRSELGETRYRLETAREGLETAREERERLRAELAETDAPSEDRLDEIDRRVEGLRSHRRELDSLVNRLSTVVGFNERMLEGENGLRELMRRDAESNGGTGVEDGAGGAVTDGLLPDDTTVCWTCGAEATVDDIGSTLDRLRDMAREKRAERGSVTEELESLTEDREELDARRERREELDARLADAEADVEEREARAERLETRLDEQESRLEQLESELERLEADRDDVVAEHQREATDLEFEIGRLSSELKDAKATVEELEGQVEREAELRERREALSEEIESLRTRIETVERDAVESFNEHAEELLDALQYDNIERIWLERRGAPEGSRNPTDRGEFDLHVVRRTDDGVVYEDTVEHLSESEREVTGLVFALAGYLTHEVHERVPFVLLDSLESIDSERIARLVDHFADYAPSIVVALLPEDAAALPDEYERVESI